MPHRPRAGIGLLFASASLAWLAPEAARSPGPEHLRGDYGEAAGASAAAEGPRLNLSAGPAFHQAQSPRSQRSQGGSARLDAAVFRELAWRPIGPSSGTFSQLAIDSAFPYRVCGITPQLGALCVASGGGASSAAVGVGTAAHIMPDPSDPEVLFSGLWRFDRRTAQRTFIAPSPALVNTPDVGPVQFAADGKALYFATNVVWRSTSAGQTWTTISPDLTRSSSSTPPVSGPIAMIVALALSPIDSRTIWAGTSNGLIHVTRDGGATWSVVREPEPGIADRILDIEGSRFDANGVYVAVGTTAADEDRRLLRTRDGGATWTPIAAGLPAGAAHAVTEDQLRRGLLFAGTDTGPWLSFDDGGNWQALTLNLPPAPVRDVAIKDSDLVIATAGRGFWVLDDIAPLRQLTADIARTDLFLFRPSIAWRLRATAVGVVSGVGPSPDATTADGIALHYLLGTEVAGPVTLEVIDSVTSDVIRRFSSRPSSPLEGRIEETPGLHRVRWDLRFAAPLAAAPEGTLPVDAALLGLAAQPGTYQVRLTAGGRVQRQAVTIRMDPRVRVSQADLTAHFALAKSVHDRLRALGELVRGPARGSEAAVDALRESARQLQQVALILQQADARPTPALEALAREVLAHTPDPLPAR
jgi:photosystem II stability/assembly factor-like uncharacterized protein